MSAFAASSTPSLSDETDFLLCKRRKLSAATLERWIRENNRTSKTSTCLKYEKVGVCIKHELQYLYSF